MKKIFFTLITATVLNSVGYTQVKVGPSPTTIDPSAMLQVDAATTGTRGGFLLPRVALQASNNYAPLASHVAGMTVYNTATAGTAPYNVTPGYYYNDGAKWVRIAGDTEPWFNAANNAGATANTQNIYQMGKVGIGNVSPSHQLHVTGDARITEKPIALVTDSVVLRYTNGELRQMSIARLLGQLDTDGDKIVDFDDPDIDGDGIPNGLDLCPMQYGCSPSGCPSNEGCPPSTGEKYRFFYNGIVAGVHNTTSSTDPTYYGLTSYTTGETFDQNTLCKTSLISAQGCGGLTTVTGASGRVYNLVNINGQCWLKENLREVPGNFSGYTPTSLLNPGSGNDEGHWGYFNTSNTSGTSGWGVSEPAPGHGYLYQWSAALNGSTAERSQGACPTGFHVPSDCEMMYLEHGLGMPLSMQIASSSGRYSYLYNNDYGTVGNKLRSEGIGATNASGFSGLLPGVRSGLTTTYFLDYGLNSGYWTSTNNTTISNTAFSRTMDTGNDGVMRTTPKKSNAYSVRCLKN